MVFDHQEQYPSQWKAIQSIAEKVNHEGLRQWVRRAETDAGFPPGLTSDERTRMKELERENKELRRANEILKAAIAENNRDVLVVTADRELAERVRAADAKVVGPSGLLDQLVD